MLQLEDYARKHSGLIRMESVTSAMRKEFYIGTSLLSLEPSIIIWEATEVCRQELSKQTMVACII